MPEIKSKTGFGYLKNLKGEITDKCVLVPGGKHRIKEDFIFVEVGSQEELDRIRITPSLTLDQLKAQKIYEIKIEANRRFELSAPDYKVLRHREQIEAGITPTITDTEYSALLQLRQAIREASNTVEAEIEGMTEYSQLEGLKVVDHPAWPII